MLLDGSEDTKAYLKETYDGVIANVHTMLISDRIKNKNLSGNPNAGSIEAKRFANATAKNYGTARTAGKGDAVKIKPVVIQIDTDREIVEELEEKDTLLLGTPGLIASRVAMHPAAMATELDTKFFSVAKTGGTQATLTKTTELEKLEELILTLTKVKNDYVDGVPRSLISVCVSPDKYSAMRNSLDAIVNTNVDTTDFEFAKFHGVTVYNCNHLPTGCNYIAMAQGAVAQPVRSKSYSAEKVPFSDAIALELFFNYGTKVVTPDLIFWA